MFFFFPFPYFPIEFISSHQWALKHFYTVLFFFFLISQTQVVIWYNWFIMQSCMYLLRCSVGLTPKWNVIRILVLQPNPNPHTVILWCWCSLHCIPLCGFGGLIWVRAHLLTPVAAMHQCGPVPATSLAHICINQWRQIRSWKWVRIWWLFLQLFLKLPSPPNHPHPLPVLPSPTTSCLQAILPILASPLGSTAVPASSAARTHLDDALQ